MSSIEIPSLSQAKPGDSPAVRQQLDSLYLYLGIDLASFLPVAAIALMSGSVMLLTDVLDYGKGIFSALVAIAILRSIAGGGAGRFEHGVGRLATLGALFMSLAVNLSLLGGIAFSIYRLFHPQSIQNGFTALGAAMQVASVGINFWLMMRNLRIARRTKSSLMESTWRMAFADTVLSLAILLTLGLCYAFSGYAWAVYIDPACAIVALSIGIASYGPLFKKVVAELMDLSVDEACQLAVMRVLAKSFDLYNDFHGVKTRYSGGVPYITLTLSFPGSLSVDEALARVASIKNSIAEEVKGSSVEVVIVPASCAAPAPAAANSSAAS
jgi:divalent metal cation (Fe/Co/Zn/Cd) transporter